MGFPRDEACVTLLWEGTQVVVFGLLHPGRDIFGGTRIAGEHSQHTPYGQRFYPANQLHKRPWTKTAPGIDFLINGDLFHLWHGNQLLSVHKWGDRAHHPPDGICLHRVDPYKYQMNNVIFPSLARSTKVA